MQANPLQRRRGNYKYVIREDVTYLATPIRVSFENEWLRISESGDIVVKGTNGCGYAWDGCSPKVNFFDLVLLGTPDGRLNENTGRSVTYFDSLIHDVLYQFHREFEVDRKVVELLFLEYLGDFRLRLLYYGAVRLFGKKPWNREIAANTPPSSAQDTTPPVSR